MKCVYCELPSGIENSKGKEFVTIHRSCLVTLLNQIRDSLEGLNVVSNLASKKYALVYGQYGKEKEGDLRNERGRNEN